MLLDEIRHEAEEGDEASQERDDDVEIGQVERDGPDIAWHASEALAAYCLASTRSLRTEVTSRSCQTGYLLVRKIQRRLQVRCYILVSPLVRDTVDLVDLQDVIASITNVSTRTRPEWCPDAGAGAGQVGEALPTSANRPTRYQGSEL